MDLRFMVRFKTDDEAGAIGNSNSTLSRKRCLDKETYDAIRNIMETEADASSVIQSATQVLASNDTANSIIMSTISPRSILFKKEAIGKRMLLFQEGYKQSALLMQTYFGSAKLWNNPKPSWKRSGYVHARNARRLKLKLSAGALFRKLQERKRRLCSWL